MKKEQKKVLIVIWVILAIIAIIAFIMSVLIKDEKKEIKDPEEPPVTHRMNTEISLLKSENTILILQSVLNNYLELISSNDNNVINLLDKDFVNKNSINKDNVVNQLSSIQGLNFNRDEMNDEYSNIITASFVPKKVFSNSNSETIYYFIEGYIDMNSIVDSKFLVILNNSDYVIIPLDNNISDIEAYANNYDIVYKEIDSGNNFSGSSSLNEENKISLYLSEFKNMLLKSPKKAYDMLYEDGQNRLKSMKTRERR